MTLTLSTGHTLTLVSPLLHEHIEPIMDARTAADRFFATLETLTEKAVDAEGAAVFVSHLLYVEFRPAEVEEWYLEVRERFPLLVAVDLLSPIEAD